MIKEQSVDSHNATLEMSHCPPGVYMLQCTYESSDVSVHKIIIQ